MKFLNSLFRNKINVCPNCKSKLKKMPKRKQKCPSCQNFIFVRTDPSTNKKVLTSEIEAKKIDEKWEEKSMVKKWIINLAQFGIKKNDFKFQKNEMLKKSNKTPRDKDVIWSLLNRLNAEYIKKNDYGSMSRVYYNMALFLGEEGKDFFVMLQESAKMRLLEIETETKDIGKRIKVRINTGGEGSCENCRKLEEKVFTLKEAMEQNPIPYKECTYKMFGGAKGFCRCLYLFHIEKPNEH